MSRFFEFTCHACGVNHHIIRSLVLVCPICSSIPGERCVDLRTSGERTYRVTVHPERDSLIKVMDG